MKHSRAPRTLLAAALAACAAGAAAETPPPAASQTAAGFAALDRNQAQAAVRAFAPGVAAGEARAIYGLGRTYLTLGGCAAGLSCPTEAKPLIRRAAQLGDPDAAYLVAMWAEHGALDEPVDLAVAASWYEKAGQGGNIGALIDLGLMCSRPGNGACDGKTARTAYATAGDLGNPFALYALGELYRRGELIPRDLPAAASAYARAAERGWASAHWRLGDAYAAGAGTDRDYGRAKAAYERALAQGEPGGAAGLANLYELGLGVPRDPAQALKLNYQVLLLGRRTDRLGDNYREPSVQALHRLSRMYAEGELLPKDADKARRLLRTAAAFGDTEAVRMTQADAEAGEADAQYELAELYNQGEGVPADPAQARKWWRAAGEQGQAQAALKLGLAYSSGDGGPEDLAQGYYWLLLAETLAKPDARRAIAGQRGALGQALTPAQKSQAEQAAKAWTAARKS
ncbi:tetratricopeptide repeat protein [Caulobacter hibisci]|uniref:Sel1 repeat family protein n=1 Tax=Caulobacter hibisci TaxID=2035993 RepID=A0ABS0T1Y1_9CAUL|nr:SEL1-like repeat protein [Caulobacter hibisci]MBI1685883.1 sel1 repeat family protein [Caulobacter hibisci]